MMRAIAILVCGIVANLLVAALCCLYSPRLWSNEVEHRRPPTDLRLRAEGYSTVTTVEHSECFGYGINRRATATRCAGSCTIYNFSIIDIHHAGWPIASFTGQQELVTPGPSTVARAPKILRARADIPLVRRSFPTVPNWPGLVLNSLFYAAVIWAAATLAASARRFLRLRAGLCPACKYPIGNAPVCTECGRAIPGRAAPT